MKIAIIELPCSDGLEMTYDEYRLNELLSSNETVVQSATQDDIDELRESILSEKKATLGDSKEAGNIQAKDFKSLGMHIFKYSSSSLEQPKLYYSVMVTVRLG